MFFRVLLMDFSILAEYILNSKFTYYLSVLLAKISYHIFNLLNVPVISFGKNIALYDAAGVLVDDTCLGYRGVILFAFFIFAYYGHFIKKIIYVLVGFIVLETGNVLRICLLAQIQYCCPEKFHFFHFYLSKFIFYTLIFILWIYWVERYSSKKNVNN